jgi:hypothetical protein
VTANGPGSSREYQDGAVRLAVDLPGDGSIRVRAAADGVGTVVDLSITGAQRLATMLGGAIATAITRGLPGGGGTD